MHAKFWLREYVRHEIETLNKIVVERGSILKVIFENDCTSNQFTPYSPI